MKRWIIPGVVSLVAVAVLALLVYGITHQSPSRTLDEQVAKGEHPLAPRANTSLPRLIGAGKGSLAGYRGKVVLLNFWASWCEPCRAEAPLLEQADKILVRHGGTVLGVTYRDNSPDSLGFVHEFHLTYPSLRDANGEFANAYGTDQLPESFMINRQGQVVKISRGEISSEWIIQAMKLADV